MENTMGKSLFSKSARKLCMGAPSNVGGNLCSSGVPSHAACVRQVTEKIGESIRKKNRIYERSYWIGFDWISFMIDACA